MATRNKTNSTKYHFIVKDCAVDRHGYACYTLNTNMFFQDFSISPDNKIAVDLTDISLLSVTAIRELKYILTFFEDMQEWIDEDPKPIPDIIEEFYSDITTGVIWLEYED